MARRLSRLTSEDSVKQAVSEFDRIGRPAFLRMYGFGRSRDYFLDYKGRYYDSKAIVGVAYGLQHPTEGRLNSDDFSGGEHTVKPVLMRLGFDVVPNPYRCLVLTENEVHARPEFAKWRDVTGERYHFPNIYRNRIVAGREFVYYKGGRRLHNRRAVPEYFGWGRIGAVYLDPTTAHLRAVQQHWLCDIDDYHEFSNSVDFKDAAGNYRELGSSNAPTRYWEAGVREITERALAAILKEAGISFRRQHTAPIGSQHVTLLERGLDLCIRHPNSKGERTRAPVLGARNPRAKAIGDLGEELFLGWLRRQVGTDAERAEIAWVATDGLTPGWDIEDRRDAPDIVAYEIKSTNGAMLPAIEITANEWEAASKLRGRYNLVIVAECESSNPKIQIINDPWALSESGVLSIIPTTFRLSRT